MNSESDNQLSRYIQRVNRIPRLPAERERELAEAWRDRTDRDAADELLSAHLRYVVVLALKYKNYNVGLADLIAEGNLGLLKALEKFDPDKGYRFVTYATFWIRARMVETALKNWSIVRAGSPALRSKLFFKLRRESARMASLLGDGPEAKEALAKKMGMAPETVSQLLQRVESPDLSLDTPMFDDSGRTWVEAIPAEAPTQEDDYVEQQLEDERRNAVASALECLDPRERVIVERRLMATPEDELSLAELGRMMGVSRERARQLEERAKKKMRRHILSKTTLRRDSPPLPRPGKPEPSRLVA